MKLKKVKKIKLPKGKKFNSKVIKKTLDYDQVKVKQFSNYSLNELLKDSNNDK